MPMDECLYRFGFPNIYMTYFQSIYINVWESFISLINSFKMVHERQTIKDE